MKTELATALEAIEAQLLPIEQETADLETKLAELKSTKAKLEAAYQALTGKSPSKQKANRKATKPCARKQDVLSACQSVLQTRGPLSKPELEALVKAELSEKQGFNLSGVGLRMTECLRSEAFDVSSDEIVALRSERAIGSSSVASNGASENCGQSTRNG